MKQVRSRVICMLVVVVAFANGCIYTLVVNPKPTQLPMGEPMARSAVLVLTPEFSNYTYGLEVWGGADTWVSPLGPSLSEYAQNVAGSLFQKLSTVNSVEEAGAERADLVLIPRAVKAEEAVSRRVSEGATFTLVVEWTARDRNTQKIVWLKTITANASEPGQLNDTKHSRILYQKLFDDLSLKTHAAMRNAPELRGSPTP